MKSTIILITLLSFLSTTLLAQIAPTSGKKTLEVTATYDEEYQQPIEKEDLDPLLLTQMKKNVIKKATKFGFTDITVEEVGKVWYPESVASKISLETPTTENWKFQANIKDNTTGSKYKLRISLFGHTPKYIIKELSADFYCNQITKDEDKFTGKTTLQSPLSDITFFKLFENNKTSYFISLTVNGSTLNIGKKGAVLLFEDGTKINKPNTKIKASIAKGTTTYNYDSTFELNGQEVELLKNKKITDIRVFIYDKNINNSETYMHYMRCLAQ